jgi:glycosidase
VASQRGAAGSLWTLYRELIALRGQHPALSRGGASRPTIDDGSRGVVAWVREEAGQRVLFVVNYHPDVAPAFSVQVAGTPTVLFAEGLATPPAVAAGKLSFAGGLAGRGFALIAL